MRTRASAAEPEPLPDPLTLTPQGRGALLDAVTRAGDRLMRNWPGHTRTASPTSWRKPDGTLVSVADHASQRILTTALANTVRNAVVISEENQRSHTRTASTVWFIDPLDGTRQYLAGSSDFAILLSAWTHGVPALSIAYFPADNILAEAYADTLTVHRCGPPPDHPAVHSVYGDVPGLREALAPDTEYLADRYESTRVLADIALGHALGAVVEMCGHYAWDLAAPIHLITAAGAFVTDQDGEPLRLRGPHVSARHVVAARDPGLHQTLLHALNSKGQP
ncbi:hypothetical protein HLB23_40400 [Nocardia uniformis]|uniref:Uncharacterized protein n=1 Tax=Nocardia uniformis TaxID=53432 RepID=A0A849CL35_9NOCA|nr:inositol monophosphatase family protein [Nocardia uniformis]NNH76041.1 hypothetical protein [Nocardia uniformis]